MPETYVRRESHLVNDWLREFHPTSLQWRRVRLGPIPGTETPEFYGILRRWADIILYEDNTVFIIEAKMRPEPGAISQLELYGRLFPSTPEFTTYNKKKVRLIFLTTKEDPMVKSMATERNIEYVVYRPAWVEEWEKELLQR